MADTPSHESKDQTAESPAPEALKPRSEDPVEAPAKGADSSHTPDSKAAARLRRRTYRPSHKGTFMGLAVIVAILAVNAIIIGVVLKGQSKSKDKSSQGEVTISQASLDKLGVNRSAVGDVGVELVVSPNARFNGKVQVGGDVSIGGQLKLNGKFSATEAAFAKLQAGDTALEKLNVNGDSTVSNLNLRKDLLVTGVSRLQGPVTMSQLLTVNNNVNIAGSLAVGGSLSVSSFNTNNLVINNTLTVGGHIITRGTVPSAAPGSAVGGLGTISISGNDTAGTVAVNIAAGGSGTGLLANIAFRNNYASTPHVVVTPVGAGITSFYINRSAGGFSIGVNSPLANGNYAFDYIVMQ